jgi:hypothetical protein
MGSRRGYEIALGSGLLVVGLTGFVLARSQESSVVVSETLAAPEFPTLFVPVAFIMGILGVALLFRRIGES